MHRMNDLSVICSSEKMKSFDSDCLNGPEPLWFESEKLPAVTNTLKVVGENNSSEKVVVTEN